MPRASRPLQHGQEAQHQLARIVELIQNNVLRLLRGSRTLARGLHLHSSQTALAETAWQVNERLVLAQLRKWTTLFELSMVTPVPSYQTTAEDEVLDEHGLSKDIARKLHAAVSRTSRQSMETDEVAAPSSSHTQGMGGSQKQT